MDIASLIVTGAFIVFLLWLAKKASQQYKDAMNVSRASLYFLQKILCELEELNGKGK